VLVLAGPTGGYLLGFLPAVFVMGWAARLAGPAHPTGAAGGIGAEHPIGPSRIAGLPRSSSRSPDPAVSGEEHYGSGATAWRRLLVLALGAVAASALIYALGIPWLALSTGLGFNRAAAVGLVPFLFGDLLKAAVAVGAVYLGGRALSQWRPSLF
jgi:biotin transporter BioY